MLAISIAHFVVPQFPTRYKYHCCTHNKTHALALIITQLHISQLTKNSNITVHTIWPLWHSSVLYHFGDASKLHYFVATDLATYYSWAMNTAGCEITSCQWLPVGSKAFLKLLLCYLDLLYWIWIETQQMVTAWCPMWQQVRVKLLRWWTICHISSNIFAFSQLFSTEGPFLPVPALSERAIRGEMSSICNVCNINFHFNHSLAIQ